MIEDIHMLHKPKKNGSSDHVKDWVNFLWCLRHSRPHEPFPGSLLGFLIRRCMLGIHEEYEGSWIVDVHFPWWRWLVFPHFWEPKNSWNFRISIDQKSQFLNVSSFALSLGAALASSSSVGFLQFVPASCFPKERNSLESLKATSFLTGVY